MAIVTTEGLALKVLHYCRHGVDAAWCEKSGKETAPIPPALSGSGFKVVLAVFRKWVALKIDDVADGICGHEASLNCCATNHRHCCLES